MLVHVNRTSRLTNPVTTIVIPAQSLPCIPIRGGNPRTKGPRNICQSLNRQPARWRHSGEPISRTPIQVKLPSHNSSLL